MKNKAIIIKVTEEEYKLYKEFANLHNKTMTDIIKDSLLRTIIGELERRE